MSKSVDNSAGNSSLFQKIRQDRKFLESVFDRIPGMIYIHDLENDVNLYRSWPLQKILGMDESEEMRFGKTIRFLIHPDDIGRFRGSGRAFLSAKDNECVVFNFRMRHQNGKWLWFRTEEYVYERDLNGKPIKCLGYATDLTETIEQRNELDRLNRDNQFLLKAAQILSQPHKKYRTALQELAQSISLHLDVVCDISILNRETDIIRPEAVYHPDQEVRSIIRKIFSDSVIKRNQGMVGMVIGQGKEILINDLPENMRLGPRSIDSRIVPRSLMYVPLLGANDVLGSLNITRLEGQEAFSEDEIAQIRRLGDYVSLFVENGLLKESQKKETALRRAAEEQMEAEKEWAEFKLRTSQVLANVNLDLENVLEQFTRLVALRFSALCEVNLTHEHVATTRYHSDPNVYQKVKKLAETGAKGQKWTMTEQVLATRKDLYIPDFKKLPAHDLTELERMASSGFCVPLHGHQHVLGTLSVTRLIDQRPLREKELDHIRDLAAHASRFIENRVLQVLQRNQIELRRKAEVKLEKTTKVLARVEAETRMILNAIPIYIARISKDLRYLFLNEAYRQRGMDPRTSEGKNVADVIGEKELDVLMVYVQKVLAGELVNYEYESTVNDGVHRYFNVVLAPDYASDGTVVGFYSCSTDMTMKVLAERTTKLTQDRLESLSLNSGDAFFFHDLQQNILDVNQVATEMLGYSREEFLGMKAEQIDPLWKGVGYQRFLESVDMNVPQTFDTVVIRKDGVHIPVEVRFVKRVEAGHVYIQSLMRDRTEKRDQELKLQQSEERLRLIFDNVEDHIAILNEHGVFESINKTSQGLTMDDVVGRSVFDFGVNEEQQEILRQQFELLKTKGINFEMSEAYTGPDGSKLIYSRKFVGIFHGDMLYKAVMLIRDVTTERDREQSVMNAVLSGQENERKRLGAELHDGIGQVLSAIALQVSQIREEVFNDDMKRLSVDLNDLNDNLQAAIREVRIISHNLMPEVLESFGLKEAINQICNNLQEGSGIKVQFDHVDVDGRYDRFVEANLFRITQELLNNIQKHARCTKVFVGLMDHGDSLNLTVEDDGIGFNMKGASKGIGLSNVTSRVNSMNGRIDVESAEKSGTLVNIDVPKVK